MAEQTGMHGFAGGGDVEPLDGGTFFVAASPAMQKLRAQVERVAKVDVPVLCLGESGTGKEVIARLLHRRSLRARQPFLKVNCAAVPADLLESELFGYERGAFTGATRSKPGKFELCNKGTLLLDEIAELPPVLQAKLLHVLQDQEFIRLGGCTKIKVDVRVIAATNVDVRQAIATKAFREDLFYRLSTFVFQVPPLRERREDIPVLLRRYVAFYAGRYGMPVRPITPAMEQACVGYEWPGNVRELENFARRFLIFGDECATPVDPQSPGAPPAAAAGGGGSLPNLKSHVRGLRHEAEAAAIGRALEQTHWNRKSAARLLQISYKSLLAKIRRYRIGQTRPAAPLERYRVPVETLFTEALRSGSGQR